MKRKPKEPKRRRAKIRAAAREQNGPTFVADATRPDGSSAAPARLLNLGNAGPYLEGEPIAHMTGEERRARARQNAEAAASSSRVVAEENADAWQRDVGRNDQAFTEEHTT